MSQNRNIIAPLPPGENYPTPLVPKAIETAMQALTIALLGLPAPTAPTGGSYDKVRIGWQQQGQPAQTIDDDVVYLRVMEADSPANRTIDVQTFGVDDRSVGQLTTYMRMWQVIWCAYGPNSFDNMRKIRSGLLTQKMHDMFAVLNLQLYLMTDRTAPRRVPEPKDGGQWWERVDWEASFYERVTEVEMVDSVASVETIVENANGVQADFAVGGNLLDSFLPPRSALGNAYLINSGPFAFGSNGAFCASGAQNNDAILAGDPQRNCSVSVHVPNFDTSSVNSNSIGLVLRFNGTVLNPTSYYLAFISANHPSIAIVKFTAGVATFIAQFDPFSFPTVVDFKFSAIGSQLMVKFNQAVVLQVDDSDVPTGLTGFITTGSGIASFTSTKL